MPIKIYKKEDEDRLTLGQVLYAKRFDLTIDKNLCKGCTVCQVVCPREAITLKPISKGPNGKALAPIVDINEHKCDFHAICAVTCPFGAIKVTVNDEHKAPTVEKEAYPLLIRDIKIDSERCLPDCKICEEKCPLGVISVRFEPFTPKEVEERERKSLPRNSQRTIVDVKTELCATCRVCAIECPANLIQVTKFFDGSIRINQELCPEGCHDCLDVCPVTALHLEDDDKVYVKDVVCIYCGACVNVCPKPDALEMERTSVRHTSVKSGAWNKALEKLTSTSGLAKELGSKRTGKARDAIKNLKLTR